MSTDPDRCALCGSDDLTIAVDLPALPLTDTLCSDSSVAVPGPFDQALLFCQECSHLQLRHHLPPDLLYGVGYGFRTSSSGLGRSGTAFFLETLDRIASGRRFRLAVDIGCNDLHLLSEFGPRAARRIGIDPIWQDQSLPTASDIEVIGATIEDTDIAAALGEAPDLILCRHTLEHLADPAEVICRLVALAAEDALLLFEIPGLEGMIARLRFDQVFHQHLHYFSRNAMHRMVQSAGGAILGEVENWHDWGARITAFEKRANATSAIPSAPFGLDDIRARYALFRRQMAASAAALDMAHAAGPTLGYGAAQMLPVLAWHLGSDFGCLEAVLDDDPGKDGLRYANLPVGIRTPLGPEVWRDATILVTAMDHAAPILHRILADRPRQIILPLAVI